MVLIVEDDSSLLEAIKYNLKKEGCRVNAATDGAMAIEIARVEHPGLIILDIMLTAKTEEIDKFLGLEIGADDYITKPFGMRTAVKSKGSPAPEQNRRESRQADICQK